MDFPFSFFVAAALVVALCADLWRYRREAWALPALIIYLTVAAWYFSDPILYGEKYREMPPVLMSRSYWQVFAFLVFFRLAARPLSTRFVRRAHQAVPTVRVNLRLALLCNVSLWAVLLCYGTSRMEWDLFGALFPLDSRNGNLLWLRASRGRRRADRVSSCPQADTSIPGDAARSVRRACSVLLMRHPRLQARRHRA